MRVWKRDRPIWYTYRRVLSLIILLGPPILESRTHAHTGRQTDYDYRFMTCIRPHAHGGQIDNLLTELFNIMSLWQTEGRTGIDILLKGGPSRLINVKKRLGKSGNILRIDGFMGQGWGLFWLYSCFNGLQYIRRGHIKTFVYYHSFPRLLPRFAVI